MIPFILGLFIGVLIGIFVMCLIIAGSERFIDYRG